MLDIVYLMKDNLEVKYHLKWRALYMRPCCWKSSYQERRVGIPLTDLSPTHCVLVPSHTFTYDVGNSVNFQRRK